MARPPKPRGQKQDHVILVRLTGVEKKAIVRAARRAASPAATFVRAIVLEHVRVI